MRCSWCRLLFFFFQAEDGIRDVAVTGVQTCALPILLRGVAGRQARAALADTGGEAPRALRELVGRRRREVVLLVLELLHGPDARHVRRQQEVVVSLEVNRAGVGRARDEVDHPRSLRISNVHDRDAVAEGVTDVGVAAMDHDLNAVAAASLVRMTHEREVARCDGRHGVRGEYRATRELRLAVALSRW